MFRRRWDSRSVVNHIMSRHGRKPLNAHWYAMEHPDVYAAAERLFGSWGNAIKACGLDYGSIRKYRTWSEVAILAEIKKACRRKLPLNSNYVQKMSKPLYMAAIRRFGNWGAAVEAAGVDYGNVRLRRKMGRRDVKMEILDLYRRGVDLAYPNMRENNQYLLAAGMKKLGNGSWVEARRKCGILENYRICGRKNEDGECMEESA